MVLLAGNSGSRGLQDGTGLDALFSLPSACALDTNGSIFVADTGNHAIRKVTTGGAVTLVAGGSQGLTEGTGSAAKFDSPAGIAIDASNVIYVADTSNNRVRKIVGTTTSAFVGGGTGASDLAGPTALACDRSGNLFIADSGHYRILKVPAGSSTPAVFAGSGSPGLSDGSGAAAQFIAPSSLAVDFNGNVYVGDGAFLRKITSGGVVSSLTVSGTTFGRLSVTTDRQADGSVLYAADDNSDRLFTLKRDVNGNFDATLLAGSSSGYQDGTGAAARFKDPYQLFVAGDGTLWVPDNGNNVIRKVQ